MAGNMELEYLGVGCNPVAHAAAWGPTGLVAYGAHRAVAIYDPQEVKVLGTLPGHKDRVNCVEWVPRYKAELQAVGTGSEALPLFLASGASDGGVIFWVPGEADRTTLQGWQCRPVLPAAHTSAVTCLAGFLLTPSKALLVSTSSDGTFKTWIVTLSASEERLSIALQQTVTTGARSMLCASVTTLPGPHLLLALGGLDNSVHLYSGGADGQNFTPACQLRGHQDWIRSLDFLPSSSPLLLATASQDRNIRIWKLTPRSATANGHTSDPVMDLLSLYASGPVFTLPGQQVWEAALESLLVGHEDWVYSVQWQPPHGKKDSPQTLLSASMDRTMLIWRPDEHSGLWLNEVSVGEIGASNLGFYGGVWGPDGEQILAHAYGGSFHLWGGERGGNWRPQLAVSGHFAPVVDCAWDRSGEFILTVSHDQTARVTAEWDWGCEKPPSWHELARPQVHGHDLHCCAWVGGGLSYVSGAEEKVARAFQAPQAFVETLAHTPGGVPPGESSRGVKVLGANMSALGLSQKPIYADAHFEEVREDAALIQSMEQVPPAAPAVLQEPPLEEHLAQNTLWPEVRKLYGHGNELWSMCASRGGDVLATASKAQAATTAAVWLWDTATWRALGQLPAHTLTVTQMEFSPDDHFLAMVSRDRHLSLWAKAAGQEPPYRSVTKLEAHKRIIWAVSWAPGGRVFATGSRDKTVKVWGAQEEGAPGVQLLRTLPVFASSVTALAWAPALPGQPAVLAVGLENGAVEVWRGSVGDASAAVELQLACKADAMACHVADVKRLCWRQDTLSEDNRNLAGSEDSFSLGRDDKSRRRSKGLQLASCGDDHALRLYNLNLR